MHTFRILLKRGLTPSAKFWGVGGGELIEIQRGATIKGRENLMGGMKAPPGPLKQTLHRYRSYRYCCDGLCYFLLQKCGQPREVTVSLQEVVKLL